METMSWIDWVLEKTGYKFYDQFLEETSEEEKEDLEDEYDDYCLELIFESMEYPEDDEDDDYVPSSSNGDHSPSNPWDAPGMSIHDFI